MRAACGACLGHMPALPCCPVTRQPSRPHGDVASPILQRRAALLWEAAARQAVTSELGALGAKPFRASRSGIGLSVTFQSVP